MVTNFAKDLELWQSSESRNYDFLIQETPSLVDLKSPLEVVAKISLPKSVKSWNSPTEDEPLNLAIPTYTAIGDNFSSFLLSFENTNEFFPSCDNLHILKNLKVSSTNL